MRPSEEWASLFRLIQDFNLKKGKRKSIFAAKLLTASRKRHPISPRSENPMLGSLSVNVVEVGTASRQPAKKHSYIYTMGILIYTL